MGSLLNFLTMIFGGIGSLLFGGTGNTRQQLLEDREHTEMREDTAYQRGVSDMKAAGLNPYTIGANPAPSSASRVNEDAIGYKLQMLGYVLDMKNLSLKNKKITNDAMTNLLNTFTGK